MNIWQKLKTAGNKLNNNVSRIISAMILLVVLVLAPTFISLFQRDDTVYSASYPVAHAPSPDAVDNVVSVDDSSVFIPTTPPVPVQVFPDAPGNPAVSVLPAIVVSNQAGGSRPVSLTVERHLTPNEWLGDRVIIGTKEAALTTDMLRKDGGDTGIFNMPANNDSLKTADLSLTLTDRGAKLMSSANFGLRIDALYGKILLPVTTLQNVKQDTNVALHIDTTIARPVGAQGLTMSVHLSGDSNHSIGIILPVEDNTLNASQLKKLKILVQLADGTQHYVNSTVIPYGDKYKYGVQFEATESGGYTVVLSK
ncbi:hypothetical protein ACE3MZ_22225 [Paenibacillus sp. WLX1005]|uniref:hypothetical protein n=1 Tax=Paenibacillus sp. WLX1005 TaxID=3243766 RepID=UPI003984064A